MFRQVMAEFNPEIPIYLVRLDYKVQVTAATPPELRIRIPEIWSDPDTKSIQSLKFIFPNFFSKSLLIRVEVLNLTSLTNFHR